MAELQFWLSVLVVDRRHWLGLYGSRLQLLPSGQMMRIWGIAKNISSRRDEVYKTRPAAIQARVCTGQTRSSSGA